MNIFKKSFESDRNQDATLYIGNLDQQVNESILFELFIQFAPIKTINLPKDKILKTHQGYGFIELHNIRDCEYVEKLLSGIRLFGKSIKLKKSSLEKYKDIDIGAILFIRNLNPLIDEKFLDDTFKKFGNFVKPPVVARDEAGISKEHGFLYFSNFEDSDNVIKQMNNQYLMNQQISIDYSLKKNGKDKHGDKVERLLARNAQKNNYNLYGNQTYHVISSTPSNNSQAIQRFDSNNVRVGSQRGNGRQKKR